MVDPSNYINKTNFLVAIPLALVAIMEGVLGMDVPGVALQDNWVEALIGSFGIMSFRDTFRKILDGLAGK